jgi:hypothetical protein
MVLRTFFRAIWLLCGFCSLRSSIKFDFPDVFEFTEMKFLKKTSWEFGDLCSYGSEWSIIHFNIIIDLEEDNKMRNQKSAYELALPNLFAGGVIEFELLPDLLAQRVTLFSILPQERKIYTAPNLCLT